MNVIRREKEEIKHAKLATKIIESIWIEFKTIYNIAQATKKKMIMARIFYGIWIKKEEMKRKKWLIIQKAGDMNRLE